MTILFMMIPVTLLLVTFFIIIFLSAIHSDQFADLETPAHGILIDEEPEIADLENAESTNNENEFNKQKK